MTRGALIFPMAVKLSLIDTVQTRDDGGYDLEFQEPRITPPAQMTPGIPDKGSPRGSTATQYADPIILEAQIEIGSINALRMALTGQDNDFKLGLVFHYSELEERGLVDANGNPRIRVGDRLDEILDNDTHELIMRVPDPPGLVAIRSEDRSFGLTSGMRNLLLAKFARRDRSGKQ